MRTPTNTFKRAITAGEAQIGLWSSLGNATAAEIIAGSGFDWILIDTEHAPNEVPDVLAQLRAMADRCAGVVRPAWNDAVMIKRLLDIGTQTLLVPFVQNAQEAARAASAVRYPPHGMRGVSVAQRANDYGRVTDYFERADEELCLLVQLESRAALQELEAIAGVDHVDGIFIGPSDLAADLGHLGNSAHEDVQRAIADALARCDAVGKPAGILAPVEDDARHFLEMGFTFVAVGSDIGLLRNASERLRTRFPGLPVR